MKVARSERRRRRPARRRRSPRPRVGGGAAESADSAERRGATRGPRRPLRLDRHRAKREFA
eukprot:4200985-Pleurochrysis_carterae.AAC.1